MLNQTSIPDAAIRQIGGLVHHCRQCGRRMGSSYNVRWQLVYCSDACRQKSYRIRHGQRYDRPGRPVKTIRKLKI